MPRFRSRLVASTVGLALCLAGSVSAAEAQIYRNPDLPRSPYVLPEPRYRAPDVEELADGNGLLHSSGQWRHWGDKRNTGETFKEFFAPDGVLGQ